MSITLFLVETSVKSLRLAASGARRTFAPPCRRVRWWRRV